MPISEHRPFYFSRIRRGEGLPTLAKIDFDDGKIKIGDSYYYLSGRILRETQVSDLSKRRGITKIIDTSLKRMALFLSPYQRPPFVLLPPSERPSPAMVGVATRIELGSFDGKLSPSGEKLLKDSLRKTIDSSADRMRPEMMKKGIELIRKAIEERLNLLCLFTLGGFFACPLSRREESEFSPQGKLLVPMSDQNVPTLIIPTEPDSLYLLHMAKQRGEEKIIVVPPAEWVAFINYQYSLVWRQSSMIGDPPFFHPGQIELACGIIDRNSKTPLRVIPPSFDQKPSGFTRKSHSGKPPRRIWR